MTELLQQAPLEGVLGLLALAVAPLVLMTITSFMKMALVFSALKNAFGAPDIPSGLIVTALSLVLSVFVMAPVAEAIQRETAAAAAQLSGQPGKLDGSKALALAERAREPVRGFLKSNVGQTEQQLFVDLARRRGDQDRNPDVLSVLWPGFVLTELKEALQIGFLIFLPFLVLDLLVANILLTLGMASLSPTLVSLPFKLLLFVSVDGWVLLSRALIVGYN